MSQYNRNKSLPVRLLEAELDLSALHRELDQLRRVRFPQADLHRDIRWAMTVGSVPSTYPAVDANTFPIRFLDAHFTKSAGLRTFTYHNRSDVPVTIAHAATGQYIPPDLPLPVFWQRGLGAEGSGEWWFLDPPRMYVVELTSELAAGTLASAEIWLPDEFFELHASGIIITVRDGLLVAGESLPVGTRLLAHWYLTPFPHWIVSIGSAPAPEVVRFELIGELSLTGHAKAKLKKPAGGGVWEDTDPVVEIEVFDPYRPEGMWNGYAGYQGFALPRGQTYTDPGEDEEDPEDDEEREAYDVQWMERIAQAIEFTAAEYMGATIDDQLAASLVTWFDHQGKDPGSTVTVHDPQGQFPDVFAGAVGKAQYDNHAKKYRIVNCQRVALFATAQLTADTCPDAESISITDFTIHPTGNYVGAPPTTPTAVAGSIAGLAGDTVWLRRTTNDMPAPGWEVVRVTKHAVDVVIDDRYNSLNLQHKLKTIFVELCDDEDPAWTTWATAVERDCTEETE